MEEEKETKKKPENKDEVELTEVVTETGLAYKLPTGEVVDERSYLVWLGNLVWKTYKSIA